jgi:hypothetical protein
LALMLHLLEETTVTVVRFVIQFVFVIVVVGVSLPRRRKFRDASSLTDDEATTFVLPLFLVVGGCEGEEKRCCC